MRKKATIGSEATVPAFDVAQYLEHAGYLCAFCQLPGGMPNWTKVEFNSFGGVAVLLLPVNCYRCRAHWVDVYRLVDARGSIPEASAAAKQAFDPSPSS
jgi:hypothetical protein